MIKGKTITEKTNRRALLTGAAAAIAVAENRKPPMRLRRRRFTASGQSQPRRRHTQPVYRWGNLLFLSGVVYRTPGDIKAHFGFALSEIRKQLEAAAGIPANSLVEIGVIAYI